MEIHVPRHWCSLRINLTKYLSYSHTLKLVLFAFNHSFKQLDWWVVHIASMYPAAVMFNFKYYSTPNVIAFLTATNALPFIKRDRDRLLSRRQATLVYPSSQEGWLDFVCF